MFYPGKLRSNANPEARFSKGNHLVLCHGRKHHWFPFPSHFILLDMFASQKPDLVDNLLYASKRWKPKTLDSIWAMNCDVALIGHPRFVSLLNRLKLGGEFIWPHPEKLHIFCSLGGPELPSVLSENEKAQCMLRTDGDSYTQWDYKCWFRFVLQAWERQGLTFQIGVLRPVNFLVFRRLS